MLLAVESQSLSGSLPSPIAGWKSETLVAIVLFLVGISLFFRVEQIPGGFDDARFNMYVVEHGYRWLMGLDKSFWSAPFFFPAQNVITYSDNHLGSFLFYSVFRILGADRETAFQLWAITLFTLNYFVTWIVLRRQRFHPVGALSAAYLFTFPYIMGIRIGFIQLAPRFMVPVAFWMASRFFETGKGKYLHWFLAACAYQAYLGIYIGYFLILAIGPFCLFLFLLGRRWNAISAFIKSADRGAIVRRGSEYAASCIGFVLVLLPLAIPYYQTQRKLGTRSWEEIVPMLPHWRSYLQAPESYLWGKLLHFGDILPLPFEQALFLGALPYLGIVAFIYLSWKRRMSSAGSEIRFAMLGVFFLLAVLTLYSSGFTLYRYVWAYLPGAGGIRAVTRVALVLIYPVAFIFGSVVTHLMTALAPGRAGSKRILRLLLGISVLGLTVLDQTTGFSAAGGVTKRECQRRLAQLEAKIVQARGNNLNRKVLWVNDQSDKNFIWSFESMDAMLAGQDLGLNVVNGYSGLFPKGYPPAMFFLTGDCCNDLGVWARMHPGTITSNSILEIGSHCEITDDYLPLPHLTEKPVPPAH
jgi:hypothetical protein